MAIGTSTVTCDAGMRTSGVDLAGVIPAQSVSHNSPLANQDGYQNDCDKLVAVPFVSGANACLPTFP